VPNLTWIGKDAVVNHDKEVPFRLLKKVKSASVGQNSQNLVIHGDNLEALKALMPYYAGKIKCIYIDPPYNTGNEKWVYNDKVNSPKIKKWLGKVVGKEAEDLCRHDKWLCMMYPRLTLLRELLSDDGVLFVSIDDHESYNLRLILNDIFEEKNFIAHFTWMRKRKPSHLDKKVRKNTEYILCYAKNYKKIMPLKSAEAEENKPYPFYNSGNTRNILLFPPNRIKCTSLADGRYAPRVYSDKKTHVKLLNEVIVKNKVIINQFRLEGEWRYSQSSLDEFLKNKEEIVIKGNKFKPYYIRKLTGTTGELKNSMTLLGSPGRLKRALENELEPELLIGTNEDAEAEITSFNLQFDNPKPTSLIKFLIKIATIYDKSAIILDSFAGSGTTGQAVLELNNEDKIDRKFILVELEDKIAKDITAERVKRAIRKYDYKDGFEFCELDKPLFNEDGKIDESCSFEQLANYIYFTETQTNIDPKKMKGNFIGDYGGNKYYLIYTARGKNVFNKAFLKKIGKNEGKTIIYADKCLVDEDLLDAENVVFKQIPYEVKVY
jgi:adenine-specific DNA-methyltransferase